MITIGQPFAFSYRGKRAENQDCIFPSPETLTPGDRLFIVCDGVGGHQRGEVASRLACNALRNYFKNEPGKLVDEAMVQDAITSAQTSFDQYIANNRGAENMATTLVFFYLTPHAAIVAHAGDSRAYQIRNGEIIFKTKDHNLWNEWMLQENRSANEAKNYPPKNTITKAVYGTNIGPVKPDICTIKDIRPNDFFFFCTDGVLESINEEQLCNILKKNRLNNQEKKDLILEQCGQYSTDNYSALFFEIQYIGAIPEKNIIQQAVIQH